MRSKSHGYNMKKPIALFLCVMLCAQFVSCNAENGTASGTTDTNPPAAGTTTAATTESPVIKEKVYNNMKVMSFNVLGTDRAGEPVLNSDTVKADARVSVRGDKLNALLNGEEIDIAGLQELRPSWRGFCHSGLDEKYGFTGYITGDTTEGGYVIYRRDKYTVIQNGVFWLAPGAPTSYTKGWKTNFDRICTWVIFRINATDDYFLFLDTHLDWNDAATNAKQAGVVVEQIISLRDQMKTAFGVENCPLVVVGDMNSGPSSETYGVFTAALYDARVRSRGKQIYQHLSTSPGFNYVTSLDNAIANDHIIDYIFCTRNITVNDYKMIHTSTNLCEYGEFISDHNAIIADISFASAAN